MTTETEQTEPTSAAKMFGWLAFFIATACLTAALVRSCAPVPPKLPAHAAAPACEKCAWKASDCGGVPSLCAQRPNGRLCCNR